MRGKTVLVASLTTGFLLLVSGAAAESPESAISIKKMTKGVVKRSTATSTQFAPPLEGGVAGAGSNDCAGATPIAEGDTAFSTLGATTDGPPHSVCGDSGNTQLHQDIWFDYEAECTGVTVFSTCNSANFDTRIAVYEGCECPVTEARLLGCNDDSPGCTGLSSHLEVPLVSGNCYKIRLGGAAGSVGAGTLDINCLTPPAACHATAGDCDVENGSAGCSDVSCCNEVCDEDSFCCEYDWDRACVDLAVMLCGTADNCNKAPVETLPHTYTGDNANATNQCSSFPGNHTWVAFEILAQTTVRLDYCGTTPPFANGWLNLADSCPCGAISSSASFEFSCDDGGVSMTWEDLAAGTYYYPVMSEPGSMGPYTIHVDGDTSPPVEGDNCAGALDLQDGDTAFTTVGATTDGPELPPTCEEGFDDFIGQDIWFSYTAPCSATYTFSTCDQADFDTVMALYADSCPTNNANLVACNHDGDGCGGFTSILEADLASGTTYLLRLGGSGLDAQGAGTLTVSREACGGCPAGDVSFPLDGVVDARTPYPSEDQENLLGIQHIEVNAPFGASADCWTLCESGEGTPNAIANVVDHGDGTYTIELARPIRVGAVTTITYGGASGRFISHPGNANGDAAATPTDILDLIDYLNGAATSPHRMYSEDINHSGLTEPSDIIDLIDLLNGAGSFDRWANTPLPTGCE